MMEDMSQGLLVEEELDTADHVLADTTDGLPELSAEADQTQSRDEGEESRESEVVALKEIYPDFDMAQFEDDAQFQGLLRGEVRPTLQQVYEMCCPQVLIQREVAAEVEAKVNQAVEMAVAEAVERAEKNLLSHIQARGMRPQENGKNASGGVRTHPAVHRLTREDRAKLAQMAQQGETVRL